MRTVLINELQKKAESFPKAEQYSDKQRLDAEKLHAVIHPEIETVLKECLVEGGRAIIHGSVARAFLLHSAPIYWESLSPEEQSDRDIIIMDAESIENVGKTTPGKIMLKKGETHDGIRYEIINGVEIVQQTTKAAIEIDHQLASQKTDSGVDIASLRSISQNIVLQCKNNPYETVLANSLLRETQIGIEVRKVNGKLEYYVCDPTNSLHAKDTAEGESLSEVWRQQLGFVGGILSTGMGEVNIHRLIMEVTTKFGHVETDSIIALHTPRLIFRLLRDEQYGAILAADGILKRALEDSLATAKFRGGNVARIERDIGKYAPASAACDDLKLMQQFIDALLQQSEYTNQSGTTMLAINDVESHGEYLMVSLQEEFAKQVHMDVLGAIFFQFVTLSSGATIHSGLAEELVDINTQFADISQNTLDMWMARNIREVLPSQCIYAEHGLGILRNIMAACDQLYPKEIVYAFNSATNKEERLPVIRQGRSPQSMSEIMALLYVCTGNPNPSDDELQYLCGMWRVSGNLSSMFGNTVVNFEKGVSIGEIREQIGILQKRINLPYTPGFSTTIPAPLADVMV